MKPFTADALLHEIHNLLKPAKEGAAS